MPSNFFDQVSRVQAGETIGPLTLSYDDYPRSDGWSLTFLLMGQTGLECTQAAADGSDPDTFALTVPASATSTVPGGRKAFVIEAAKVGTGTYVAERGQITMLSNPRTTTPEMTILASIRAVKAGFATDGQRAISLDGIQLRQMSPAELDSWEERYIKLVNSQIGRAGGNGGVYAIKARTPQDNRYAAPWYGPYPGGTR